MSDVPRLNIKVVFCISCTQPGVKCKWNKKCIYAHTISEIQPIKCKYDTECKTRTKEHTCPRIHTGETISEYALRLGFKARNSLRKPQQMDSLAYAKCIIKKLASFPPIDPDGNKGAMIMKKWGWEPGKGIGKYLQGVLIAPSHKSPGKLISSKPGGLYNPFKPIKFVKGEKTLTESFTRIKL